VNGTGETRISYNPSFAGFRAGVPFVTSDLFRVFPRSFTVRLGLISHFGQWLAAMPSHRPFLPELSTAT
jgi:hypothetical protein